MNEDLPSWWPEHPAIYDINKTYLENAEEGPFFNEEIPLRNWSAPDQWIDFLGYKIASPIGIPAGPLLNAKWIGFAANMGFDVVAYKTIRSHECSAHPLPNIVPVNVPAPFDPQHLPKEIVRANDVPQDLDHLGITNSFGNPSRTKEYLMEDIPLGNALLHPGQVMIVSIFGSEQSGISLEEDFVQCARFAADCGAQIIEANYSCPNVSASEGALYNSPDAVYSFTKKIVETIGDIPLIIKMGWFSSLEEMRQSILAAARGGARAICGINTISLKVFNEDGSPSLGPQRPTCGICGIPIRKAALTFTRHAREVLEQEKLDLQLLITGGAMRPEHLQEMLDAGADIAMTATGMMWDPLLAMRFYHQLIGTP